jgi:CheY-like chemotaxis protein
MDIIIAEDDPVNQKVTLLMLRKLGIHAEAAANGLEVLQALERHHFDIVLMDIQMPEMDGIEATKIIRERWTYGPKIIVITDCDSNTYRELCFDAGANEFLAKPVMIEELTAAIEHNGTMESYLRQAVSKMPKPSEISRRSKA